ncbi:hypothetical protein TZ90_01766 [Streptococcus mitis]|uniref:Uncharacterized protein n=1 Tax=Streptococcus mitis TaxID=28037 RepID=A0A0F2D9C9_STRMT|nr:hypothetical protein TZ90_01766 [Streptococcus mitis]RSJ14644.1 hypothetical protein D8836_03210 [Streptococcus mitis]
MAKSFCNIKNSQNATSLKIKTYPLKLYKVSQSLALNPHMKSM